MRILHEYVYIYIYIYTHVCMFIHIYIYIHIAILYRYWNHDISFQDFRSPRRHVQPDLASGVVHVAHVAVAQHRRKAMGGGQQVVVVHLEVHQET